MFRITSFRFPLPELLGLPDGGQLIVCFLYRSQQRFYPENSLAVRQLAGGEALPALSVPAVAVCIAPARRLFV
jgi:hypothetical protein